MSQALIIIGLSFLLGAAMNRGSICAVAATEELIMKRHPARFLSFFEAALWGVLCLALIGADVVLRPDWMSWHFVLVGSMLFGLGAVVNGACAFGVVGRIGSGQVEYLLTGVGILVGIVCARAAIPGHDMTLVGRSTALSWPAAASILIALILARYMLAKQQLWEFLVLTAAVTLVGSLFVALGYLHQPFPWINALAGLPDLDLNPVLAVVAVVTGSTANAAVTGRVRLEMPTLRGSTRRLAGGALMGAGVVSVPGGNDGILLYGMPAGEPLAFVAYAAMIAMIGVSVTFVGRVTETWKS